MDTSSKDRFRYFLKDSVRQTIDFHLTDQNRGIGPPPLEKPAPPEAKRVDLIPAAELMDISDDNCF